MTPTVKDAVRRQRIISRRHRVEVEFHHCDMMRVVHNSQYFKWFEKGRFAIVDAFLNADEEAKARLMTPVVMNRCEYICPARVGDQLMLVTKHRISDVWTGRFRFVHSISNIDTKKELARGESEITIVDSETFKSVKVIPETVWNYYVNLR